MTEPTIPFKPEPDEALKARVYAAAADVYDILEVAKDLSTTPSKKPKHVFDFVDGMRLIISRDREGKHGPAHLHLSMSFEKGTLLYNRLKGAAAAGATVPVDSRPILKDHLERLGIALWPPDEGVQTGVIHWFFRNIGPKFNRITN